MVDAYLEGKRSLVNAYLERLLAERYPPTGGKTGKLSDAIAYSLLNGGKRIRPVLTLALLEQYDRSDDEALAAACATELIHTASIILDDLPSMDDATERRGKKANHLVYGESTAILAAIALWSEAVRLVALISDPMMREVMLDAAKSVGGHGLVRGQFIDLDAAHPPQTIADLEECYFLKTGALFKHAMAIVALLGKAPPAERVVLEQIGSDIGLIFQIRDDILDAESTREELGKDVGSDIKNGRATYVSLLGVEGAKRVLHEKIVSTSADFEQLPFETEVFVSVVRSLEVE